MGCCGQKRRRIRRSTLTKTKQARNTPEMTSGAQTATRPQTISRQQSVPNGQMVRIRYAGTRTVRIRGPITGKIYRFPALSTQNVDPRDTVAILRSPYFRTA